MKMAGDIVYLMEHFVTFIVTFDNQCLKERGKALWNYRMFLKESL